jgi:hypothetical protein
MEGFKQIWQRILSNTKGKSKDELHRSDLRAIKNDTKEKKKRKRLDRKKEQEMNW